MTNSKEPTCDAYHISTTTITDIIKVFLLGTSWETLDIGDLIRDSPTSRVWCLWREVQALRPGIVRSLKKSEKTKALAIEMEKIFKEIERKRFRGLRELILKLVEEKHPASERPLTKILKKLEENHNEILRKP